MYKFYAAGFTALKRPGTPRASRREWQGTPVLPDDVAKLAKRTPFFEPSTFSVMSLMSRAAIVRAKVAKWGLATWL